MRLYSKRKPVNTVMFQSSSQQAYAAVRSAVSLTVAVLPEASVLSGGCVGVGAVKSLILRYSTPYSDVSGWRMDHF